MTGRVRSIQPSRCGFGSTQSEGATRETILIPAFCCSLPAARRLCRAKRNACCPADRKARSPRPKPAAETPQFDGAVAIAQTQSTGGQPNYELATGTVYYSGDPQRGHEPDGTSPRHQSLIAASSRRLFGSPQPGRDRSLCSHAHAERRWKCNEPRAIAAERYLRRVERQENRTMEHKVISQQLLIEYELLSHLESRHCVTSCSGLRIGRTYRASLSSLRFMTQAFQRRLKRSMTLEEHDGYMEVVTEVAADAQFAGRSFTCGPRHVPPRRASRRAGWSGWPPTIRCRSARSPKSWECCCSGSTRTAKRKSICCKNHCCRKTAATTESSQQATRGAVGNFRFSRKYVRDRTPLDARQNRDSRYHGGMNNAQSADILDQIADLLEFQAANPFRVRALSQRGPCGPRIAHESDRRDRRQPTPSSCCRLPASAKAWRTRFARWQQPANWRCSSSSRPRCPPAC